VLVAAAVCPCPPLLVPEVAAGAAPELDELRAACDAAVGSVLAASPDVLVVVGAGEESAEVPHGAVGSLAPYGVDLRVSLDETDASAVPATLPLSLTVGAWLLRRQAWAGERRGVTVDGSAPASDCAALGRSLAGLAARVALLVVGDGSARRSLKAPGYLDTRAEPYDAALAEALASGDATTLAALDPAEAEALLVGGRAAFQVLAGAAEDAGAVKGHLRTHEAPYGVGYLVATWTTPGAGPSGEPAGGPGSAGQD
jgi:hypothetical protein